MAQSSISRFSKTVTDPLRSFRFHATFLPAYDDFQGSARIREFSGGFTTVSGLSITTQPIGYREGGFNTTMHQVPGMTSFAPLTFQRGVLYSKDEAMTWMKLLFAATAGDGISEADGKGFRCNIELRVLDHPITGGPGITDNDSLDLNRTEKMRFNIYNAWITNLSYSDLNAQDNQLLFETMQLVHEGMSVSFPDPAAPYRVLP